MYSTYVLYSLKFNKIYIGFSGNLQFRLETHNDPHHKGWSAQYRPWQILFSEDFRTKAEAMSREKQLKSS